MEQHSRHTDEIKITYVRTHIGGKKSQNNRGTTVEGKDGGISEEVLGKRGDKLKKLLI